MKIAIIAAMEAELNELLPALENAESKKRAGFRFHTGSFGGIDVVLLLSGIGKVNAAVGTSLLVDEYAPDYVINTGVAGGFDEELEPGDLVISNEVRHHDVDATPFDYQIGQVPGMPVNYTPDKRLLALAMDLSSTISEYRVRSGLIVSGDSFIHRSEDVGRIRRDFPNAMAGEMEAAAIAQSCYVLGIPWLIARSISDVVGNDGNAMEYSSFVEMASKRSAFFVTQLVKRMERFI